MKRGPSRSWPLAYSSARAERKALLRDDAIHQQIIRPCCADHDRSRPTTRAQRAAAPSEALVSNQTSAGLRETGFHRFELRPELLEAVADAGFESPRPIQEGALPRALAGSDVLGLAQTGTGKTAAFVLPILQRLLTSKGSGNGRGPRALVVVPTRELANQVHADFEKLGCHTPMSALAVFGGVPIARHERQLRNRPDVIVACPGRLLDLVNRGALRLSGVEVLVLDEADHMFDMGFLPDVRRILAALPKKRQNLMFSATMPREIRGLADAVLDRPHVVELAHSQPAETIAHGVMALAEGDKVTALERLLSGSDFRSAIVFLRTKHRAKRLAARLEKRGHHAIALQGNMRQGKREQALAGFRSGEYDVLVATDIAARGLDIEGVSHVVNFDVPNTPDAYTHRIGRTGRSERSGRAVTFVTSTDAAAVRAIEKRLGAPIERLGAGAGKGRAERPEERGEERGGSGRRRSGPRPTRSMAEDKKPASSRRSSRSSEPLASKPAVNEPVAQSSAASKPMATGPAFGAGIVDADSPPGKPAEARRRRARRRRPA